MQEKPLHIPPHKKFKGLKVLCYQCGTLVNGECKQTGKSIASCKYPLRHAYKVIVHVPGTKNERRVKILHTRDYDEAIKEAIAFQEEVKHEVKANGEGKEIVKEVPVNSTTPEPINVLLKEKSVSPKPLIDLMARYVGYLHGDPEIVPEFKRKERGEEHVKDVERIFKYFTLSLKKASYDVASLHADEVNDQMIGKFHAYLLNDLQYANRSYNKAMSHMTSFYNFLASEKYVDHNPFEAVVHKATLTKVETIDEGEFSELLNTLGKPELGMHEFENGVKKNLYKPWMQDAVRLALYTGRRREEIVMMKWRDVVLDKDHKPLFIQVPDIKVNRQKGNTEEHLKYNYVPITAELWGLLEEMGYETYAGTESYILAPEETMERETMRRFMTRSFSHYYDALNTGKHLTFGVLRKTYITRLRGYLGDNAKLITGHSGDEVMTKHYTDRRYIANTAKEFSVFGESRSEHIEALREKKKHVEVPER